MRQVYGALSVVFVIAGVLSVICSICMACPGANPHTWMGACIAMWAAPALVGLGVFFGYTHDSLR